MKLRVLHITPDLDFGGLQRLVVDLTRRMKPDHFESHVLPLGPVSSLAEGLTGFATLHRSPAMGWSSMLRPVALTHQIRSIAPDVVHTHSGVWYKGSLAARNAGVPWVVHTDHGRLRPDPWTHRVVDRLASRRTDVVIAVSEVLGRQIAETVVADPSRIQVVINGVDCDAHRPTVDTGELRREFGAALDVPIIGSVGRLEFIKGYDLMIEAFALLRREWRGPQAPLLVLAGDGLERSSLEQKIAALGLGNSVFILGFRANVRAIHSALSLFTLASRSEGTSVGLLEAMSAGLCPVVTDVGGNPAVLGPDLTHRLVPAQDPASLARAWASALADDTGRRRDAQLARRRVVEHFGLDAMVRAYETIYSARRPAVGQR